MRTVIWFVFFWTTLITLTPTLRWAQWLKRTGKQSKTDAIVHPKVRWWASTLLKLAGTQVTIKGQEYLPHQPAIFVANHQGSFDIPILLTSLDGPHPLIAKSETMHIPLIRSWMDVLDCVFLDRKSPRQSASALRQAAEIMEQKGRSFVIFPEGTRSKGGPVGEFKNGAFKVALRLKAPVVPVCIQGSHRIMESNKNRICPAQVQVTILPPIDTAGMDKETSRHLGEQVRQQIIAAMSVSDKQSS